MDKEQLRKALAELWAEFKNRPPEPAPAQQPGMVTITNNYVRTDISQFLDYLTAPTQAKGKSK